MISPLRKCQECAHIIKNNVHLFAPICTYASIYLLNCSLLAVCVDGGQPANTEELRVRLVLRDVNDNAPHFVNGSSVLVHVDETSAVGTRVASLSAVDPDSGPNGTVHYALRDLLVDGLPAGYVQYTFVVVHFECIREAGALLKVI